MNSTIEIIETNNNNTGIRKTGDNVTVFIDPYYLNLRNKSDSTAIRHMTEIGSFGKFLSDVLKLNVPTMVNMKSLIQSGEWTSDHAKAMLEEWSGITANNIETYKEYMISVKGLRTTTISQVIYILKSYARIAYNAGSLPITELTRIEHIKGISGSEAVHIDEHREKTAERNRHNVGGNVTTLTKKQVTMLKFGHPDSLDGKRDALLFCILLDHGLRISDAIALKRNDIDMENKMIHFTTKKTGVSLNLRMTEDVYNAFCEYFDAFQPADEESSIWTGVNKHGKAQGTWGKHSAQMEITLIAKSMGIRNLSAHDLRHCWTDRAIEGGSDLVSVQQAGGWKSLQMVGRYATKKAVSNSGVKLS